MQLLFLEWAEHDTESFSNLYIDPFDIGYLRDFHNGIDEKLDSRSLINKVHQNVSILESIASEVFRFMANKVYGTPLNIQVDPYTMSLKVKPQSAEKGDTISEAIRENVRVMWLYKNVKT
jgi:hypothetical protein